MPRATPAIAALGCALVAGLLAPRGLSAQTTNADGVSLRASLSTDTVYVGQQVTYTLSVQIPSLVRQRLRRNPEFVPPEPRAMLAYDLPLSRVGEPDDPYEVHTFRRALFVLTPGRYTLGAARLTYALPQSSSFFSREDDRVLRAEGLSFVAVEPPTRGRPSDWTGAVGQWRSSLRAEPTSTRVGDPFVLVLRLDGVGNATLLPRPALRIPWADVVPQDERVTLDSTPALFSGAKEFTWLVTPREAGAQTVAAVEYPSFDPAARRYVRLRTEPLLVNVRPGSLADVPLRGAAAPQAVAALTIRNALAGPAMVRPPARVPFTWLALVAPLPWVLLRLRRGRSRRERQSAPAVPSTTRSLLDQGLRTRTGVDAAMLTAPGALAAALRLEGVTAETALEAEALRDACDHEGFDATTAGRASSGDLKQRTLALLAKVNTEARRRAMLLLAMLALAGCVQGGSVEALQHFTEGRTAYVGGDYARAREGFRRAVLAAPRDPATWANYGSAAWQLADTAAAVHGWQRALHLDPTDRDLRDRLARVTAPQHKAADLWPIPSWPIIAAGLLLWLIGWGLAARRQWRDGRSTRWPLLALVPGALAIAIGAWQEQRLDARDLVVIHEAAALRALPALGADPGAVPMRGEVARVLERRGVWLRLELDGDRSGWYPAERTWSLARD